MKVLIFQSGEPLQIDENPNSMRAINLSNYLSNRDFEVHLWSAKFNHHTKQFRSDKFDDIKKNNINFKLIKSPGYYKNTSLRRILDHIFLALNLKKELNKINFKPDFVFIGYPPIETAYVLANWSIKNEIPYILDVKDNWPEFFLEKIPKKLNYIFFLILYPYFFISKKIILESKIVTSISHSFLKWCQNFANRKDIYNDKVYYLLKPKINKVIEANISTNIRSFSKNHSDRFFQMLFVGNHYPSIDLETVILGTKILNKEFKDIFKLAICGNGETTEYLKRISKNDKNIIFLDRVNQDEILFLSEFSKVFLCPFLNINAFQMSLPNKILDAFLLNLPIITSFNRGETFDLLKKNKIDFIYEERSPMSFAKTIKKVYLMTQLEYSNIKSKIKNVYLENFDFEINNETLIKHIEKVIKNEN